MTDEIRFAGRTLSPETIQKTRQHFADLAQRCIDEAERGDVKVNDLPRYVAWRRQHAADALAGKEDRTLTFRQYGYYLETGESIALLP